MVSGNRATEERAVAMACLGGADRVLVVGCGPGVGVVAAARVAESVLAIDPSSTMVRSTRRRVAREGASHRVCVTAGTADLVDAPAASFDAVVSVNNLHLWPWCSGGFRELRRVLRPEGRLVVSAHLSTIRARRQEVLQSAEECGFHVEEVRTWSPRSRLAGTAWQLRAWALPDTASVGGGP